MNNFGIQTSSAPHGCLDTLPTPSRPISFSQEQPRQSLEEMQFSSLVKGVFLSLFDPLKNIDFLGTFFILRVVFSPFLNSENCSLFTFFIDVVMSDISQVIFSPSNLDFLPFLNLKNIFFYCCQYHWWHFIWFLTYSFYKTWHRKELLVCDILANGRQWPPEKVSSTPSYEVKFPERLLRILMNNSFSRSWEMDLFYICFSSIFVVAVANFYHWVIHCVTLVNLFQFSFMIGVMGTHLSEMFWGLIMFQKHLEHESLVHY